MKSLETSSYKTRKWIFPAIFLILAFVGFLDATYLTFEHFRGGVPTCNIIKGCEIVTTSKYSTIGNIPIALMGSIYYAFIIILTVMHLDTKRDAFFHLANRMTIAGFVASLYLIYLQFFVLHAICIYCMLSATTSTLLFILGILNLKLTTVKGKEINTPSEDS